MPILINQPIHSRFLEDALDRSKAIDAAVSQIERQFGKGSIMRMGDEEPQRVA
jgi:RecA/RadA recombinase